MKENPRNNGRPRFESKEAWNCEREKKSKMDEGLGIYKVSFSGRRAKPGKLVVVGKETPVETSRWELPLLLWER